MHTRQDEGDLSFLMEVMVRIAGSSDMQTALVDTLIFLKKHFPVEAISLHQYSPKLRSLKLLFLVRETGFTFVERIVPVPPEETGGMLLHNEGVDRVRLITCMGDSPVSRAHGEALSAFVPFRDRAYLIALMQSGAETLGHLCMMGTEPGCFSPDHERRFSHLLTPFTLVMANLLQNRRTLDFQRRCLEGEENLCGLELLREQRIVGEQGGLRETMDIVYQLSGREIPALILGETGTGKELVADVIHEVSPRKDKPFIKVNCGAIPEALVDSELFGYEKGAFTGAATSRPGRFEQAHGGTLFLDEVGELPLQAQVRLLRVLQNGVVERLGSTKSIAVDVRIIAATNRSLEHMMQAGMFREDLYYRLYVFPIFVPPLRSRIQDIPELIYLFLRRACDMLEIGTLPQIPAATLQRLMQYSWPGNVRELENLIKRGLTLFPKGPLLLDKLLPQDPGWYVKPAESQSYLERCIDSRVEVLIRKYLPQLQTADNLFTVQKNEESIPSAVKTMDEAVREAISRAMSVSRGKIHGPGGAAEILGINPNTLRGRMRRLGML